MDPNFTRIPEDYICPITQELMKDPVVAADGQSYERDAILHWLQGGHRMSPLTGEKLKNDALIENYRLKSIIETFQQEAQREKHNKTDMNAAIGLLEEMIVQEQEEKRECAEALKKKDEENQVLKESLLDLQRQLQEMQFQRKLSVQPIPKNAAYNPKGENLKMKSKTTSIRFLQCSICRVNVNVLESLIFINKYCKHRYCRYCIQIEGKPNVSLCYLRVCAARLDLQELTNFTFIETGVNLND